MWKYTQHPRGSDYAGNIINENGAALTVNYVNGDHVANGHIMAASKEMFEYLERFVSKFEGIDVALVSEAKEILNRANGGENV